MRVQQADWEARAAAKRASTHDKIPKEWLLASSDLGLAGELRDLTGSFINSFLDSDEIAITATPALELVSKIRKGEYSSLNVTKAFCHRTAVGQQIVRIISRLDDNVWLSITDGIWVNMC